jgi:KUP system potassium uptake protein
LDGSSSLSAQPGIPAVEPTAEGRRHRSTASARAAEPWGWLAALGVVFGDLGTSPLYTLQTVISALKDPFTPETGVGILSLIVWTLVVTISIKYCIVVMRADNQGEGGIFALMSLIGAHDVTVGAKVLTCIGLLGAALIYGDGLITPAISVLSALEGVNVVTDSWKPFIMPGAVAILVLLFATQRFGTEKIGRAFGPIMLMWFIIIALLGIRQIIAHPVVLAALNPQHAIGFLVRSGPAAFLILGGVFLCITGGEALYADMGHFGKHLIRRNWYFVVLPALLLNYAGQIGFLIDKGQAGGNPFFELVPHWAIYPLVILATVATIIASQAIITGSFSMTRQATQLGWLPGMLIRQTSDKVYGQIYVPVVNWLMMMATVAITFAFGSSERLSGAYGTAVATTMLLTTILLFRAMRGIWHWPLLAVVVVGGSFLVVDAGFFGANLLKIADGGWLPLVVALCIFTVMLTWRLGVTAIRSSLPLSPDAACQFLSELEHGTLPRIGDSTIVFLTRSQQQVSRLILDYARLAGALPRNVIALSVLFEHVPRVPQPSCHVVDVVAERFWHLQARFGFFEIPDLQRSLREAQGLNADVDLDNVTFISTRDLVVYRSGSPLLRRWRLALFAFLYRNAARTIDRFRLPPKQVIELGREIEL